MLIDAVQNRYWYYLNAFQGLYKSFNFQLRVRTFETVSYISYLITLHQLSDNWTLEYCPLRKADSGYLYQYLWAG